MSVASDEETPTQREVRAHFNRTRGRLAGLIESFGLPERQERGMVATMKSLTYDAEHDLIELLKQ